MQTFIINLISGALGILIVLSIVGGLYLLDARYDKKDIEQYKRMQELKRKEI